MKVRTYGLILLVLVGIVPMVVYGAMAIARSQRTSALEVRAGNQRVARVIADRIDAFAQAERQLVAAIGSAVLQTEDARARQLMLESYELGSQYQHIHDIVIYDQSGAVIAGRVPDEEQECYAWLSVAALAGKSLQSPVTPARDSAQFAHTITIGEPIDIVGEHKGAIVARYDLVGVWPAVNAVRVGETGFVRLLTTNGHLLAHGDPEERRSVFVPDREADASLLAAAFLGLIVENRQGDEVLASAELVPSLPGIIVVEQAVTEAFADIQEMKRNLLILGLGTLGFAIVIGLFFGRTLVRSLEHLRAHSLNLAQDLERKLEIDTKLVEVRELADALDAMADALVREREAAHARERLTTFARVAAGLAHDLRMPIEAVRGACDMVIHEPHDDGAYRLLRTVAERDLPRLKRFVDDLQRLAQQGNLGLEYESVQPRALIDDVCRELESALKWRGVSFETRGSARPGKLDLNLVRRAVVNLASNAADACLELGPGRKVTIEVADCEDNVLEIRVSDAGAGISPERLAELERGDFRSSKRTSGVGLGLGVARQVVAAHGGQLVMSSQVGSGSVFTLRLPRLTPAKQP